MTTEETKKAAEVMLEAAEGKRIEVSRRDSGKWVPCVLPYWNWCECDYRVAPEPFEGWVNVYPERDLPTGGLWYHTEESAIKNQGPRCLRTIKVREVVE
jgi:hypothetical protein